jgi:hypothetical protein
MVVELLCANQRPTIFFDGVVQNAAPPTCLTKLFTPTT